MLSSLSLDFAQTVKTKRYLKVITFGELDGHRAAILFFFTKTSFTRALKLKNPSWGYGENIYYVYCIRWN